MSSDRLTDAEICGYLEGSCWDCVPLKAKNAYDPKANSCFQCTKGRCITELRKRCEEGDFNSEIRKALMESQERLAKECKDWKARAERAEAALRKLVFEGNHAYDFLRKLGHKNDGCTINIGEALHEAEEVLTP